MKPRSTEYDSWMKFKKAIQPPCDDDAFEKFTDCHFRIQLINPNGLHGYPTIEAEVKTESIHAELFERFDDFCEENMEAIREDYCDEFDFSDPDDIESVYRQRVHEVKENLSAVLDLFYDKGLERLRDGKTPNWGNVGDMGSLVQLSEAIMQSAVAALNNP